MKQQDYIDKIKQVAEQVSIPEGVSPEKIKKRLEDECTNTFQPQKEMIPKKKRISKFAVACAAGILFLGTGGILYMDISSHGGRTQNKIYKPEIADESSIEETEEVSLACQSELINPTDYDTYYETIRQIRDEYYATYIDIPEASVDASDLGIVEEYADEASMLSTDVSGASRNFSTTNTQEENIDEGDIVKTDGEYIYKLNQFWEDNEFISKLTITKASDGKLTKTGTIDWMEQFQEDSYVYIRDFYLYGNTLVFMLQDHTNEAETTILLYDISNKEKPIQTKVITQSGQYISSRIADGYLYTVSNFTDMDFSSQKPYKNYIPSVNGNLLDCSNIYCPAEPLVDSTYVVTGLNLKTGQIVDEKAVPTQGGDIYVSDSSIYIYGNVYAETTQTEIFKISYQNGSLTPGNSATISGSFYGSFALNEYNHHLRVVATIPANSISLLRTEDEMQNTTTAKEEDTSQVPREDVNMLYVLDESMTVTGQITGIAPGEQIYSARFLGDIGYLVTYENTDPLFSIDLSDPTNPVIIGKLTIPGFSQYLHPYADGLLLGIGEEINPDTQEFEGLKLSMFDISNPENVAVTHQYILPNSYYSPAEYNYKALMIDTEKNIFGFFYQNLEGTNNYYVTYRYDAENGFEETGKYEIHIESYETDSIRGLYIDDYLYITTLDSITSYPLGTTTKKDSIQS